MREKEKFNLRSSIDDRLKKKNITGFSIWGKKLLRE